MARRERRVAQRHIGDDLSRLEALIGERHISAHLLEHFVQPGAQRVDQQPANNDFRSGDDRRGNQRKRRRRRIGGNLDRAAVERVAELAQHDFAMVAARHRFLDAHRRPARHSSEQQRRLDLRRGGNIEMVDCPQLVAVDDDWKMVAALEPRAHSLKRRGHSPHRPLRQRGIAGQRDAQPGDPRACAEQQARGRSAIAAIDRLTWRGPYGAGYVPFPRPDALDRCTERRDRASRGEHVVAFEQSGDPRRPVRQRAQDQCSVRTTLVTGNVCFAGQWSAAARGQFHLSSPATWSARSIAWRALSRGSQAVSQLRSSSSSEAGPRPPRHSVTSSALISR